ncbi:hypothetical protein AB205_0104180, partial [Aquarana catesbeiana]
MVNLYPQTLVAETGDLIDFSAEEEQPGEPPAKELVLGPNFTELCQAPTAVSVELQGTSPAEALVTGQRVQDLCPTPSAVPEAQVWEWRNPAFCPKRLTRPEDVKSTAEVLAKGQSATNLCPAPATTVEIQGGGAVGPSLQRQADVVKLLLPAESLATGQSSAGLCLAPTVSLQLQEAGVIGPSVQQQTEPRNVKNHPAEALAAGQRVNDLCPTPTGVNYSLQPRMEIMRTDY